MSQAPKSSSGLAAKAAERAHRARGSRTEKVLPTDGKSQPPKYSPGLASKAAERAHRALGSSSRTERVVSTEGKSPGGGRSPASAKSPRGDERRKTSTRKKSALRPEDAKRRKRTTNIRSHTSAVWEDLKARTGDGFEIRIDRDTVIGPGVTIYADAGSVYIGKNCVLSEGVIISHKTDDGKPPPPGTERIMEIGNGNLFESLTMIEAAKIGDYNMFKSRCHVQKKVIVGHGCMVCPRVTVIANSSLANGTVLFGQNMMNFHKLNHQRHRRWMKHLVPLLHKQWQQVHASKKDASKALVKAAPAPIGDVRRKAKPPEERRKTGRIGDLRKQ